MTKEKKVAALRIKSLLENIEGMEKAYVYAENKEEEIAEAFSAISAELTKYLKEYKALLENQEEMDF